MKKIKLNLNFDWKSKLIDLLIVIFGISVAFQLNNWNESKKTEHEEKEYLESFYSESIDNRDNLVSALNFSKSTKVEIDTLKQILLSKNYSDERIKPLIASMMALSDFSPSTTTMENIIASGEFDLIRDLELRKKLISTYNSYKTTDKLETILNDYVNDYLTPFFMKNFRFSNFSSLDSDFFSDPLFENIIFGYDALLFQQIGGYESNIESQSSLIERLALDKKNFQK